MVHVLWCVDHFFYKLYLFSYCPIARMWILNILQSAVSVGRIEIEEDGKLFVFGQSEGKLQSVRITVVDEQFWTRVLL